MIETGSGKPGSKESQMCEHGNFRSVCLICRMENKKGVTPAESTEVGGRSGEARVKRSPEVPPPPPDEKIPEFPSEMLEDIPGELRLVHADKGEKTTLDERRTELPGGMSAAALKEVWNLERIEQEGKSREHVHELLKERLPKGKLDHFLGGKKGFFTKLLQPRMDPEKKSKVLKEKLYENWLEDIAYNQEKVIDEYLVDHLHRIQKILPAFNTDFFLAQISDLNRRTEAVLNTPPEKRQIDEKSLIDLNELANEPFLLKEMFKDAVREEADKKFAPLVARAHGDVRMFLVKHINTVGLEPEEAQAFLKEKSAIEAEVVFMLEMSDKEQKGGLLGLTDTEKIWVNLERVPFLENGQLDEGQLAETLTHEIVHTVSTISPQGNLGLREYNEIFSGIVQSREYKDPSEYLNELATELLALEITSKYYRPDAPGTVIIHTEEQQRLVGYKDLMEAFKAIEAKYGDRAGKLKKILVSVMVRGNYNELRDFLLINRDLLYEVRDLCARKG